MHHRNSFFFYKIAEILSKNNFAFSKKIEKHICITSYLFSSEK